MKPVNLVKLSALYFTDYMVWLITLQLQITAVICDENVIDGTHYGYNGLSFWD